MLDECFQLDRMGVFWQRVSAHLAVLGLREQDSYRDQMQVEYSIG